MYLAPVGCPGGVYESTETVSHSGKVLIECVSMLGLCLDLVECVRLCGSVVFFLFFYEAVVALHKRF